jgi:hypothetical protein
MAQTTETASEPLRLRVRVSPGNVDLVPGNPEYEDRRAATFPLREQKYIEYLQAQAVAGELDFLSGDETQDRTAIAAEASHLAKRDFDIVSILGGWGLAAKNVIGVAYWGGVDITYAMDDTLPLGDFVIEGDQTFDEAFHQMQVSAGPF